MSGALHLELHGAFEHQREFLECQKRYAIACSGTKAGKTAAGAFYVVEQLAKKPGAIGTWVAPSFSQSVGVGLEAVRGLLPPELTTVRQSGIPSLTCAGSTIEFKSADEPQNLYGPSRDFVVADEAGRISEDAWNAVRSTVTATGGPLRLLSNPTPRTGWFYRLYARGVEGDPDVASFRWKTADNPLIPAAEVEDARRTLSERTFRSLYMGEFLDVGGAVFRNVRDCATGELRWPEDGHVYVGGLDIARTQDWTVATMIDTENGNVVAWERWHGVSWELTATRVLDLSRRYFGARFFVDSTGIGDVVLEQLERCGVPVDGVKFTAVSKSQLIERLVATMERGEVRYPPIEVLLGELEAFEPTVSPSGTVRYNAPDGQHDDSVISLALAVHGLACAPRSVVAARAIQPRRRYLEAV